MNSIESWQFHIVFFVADAFLEQRVTSSLQFACFKIKVALVCIKVLSKLFEYVSINISLLLLPSCELAVGLKSESNFLPASFHRNIILLIKIIFSYPILHIYLFSIPILLKFLCFLWPVAVLHLKQQIILLYIIIKIILKCKRL